jgi:hypothetical protein
VPRVLDPQLERQGGCVEEGGRGNEGIVDLVGKCTTPKCRPL